MSELKIVRYEEIRIGWIAAILPELELARAVLDEEYKLPNAGCSLAQGLSYTVGRIGQHVIAIACLANARNAGSAASAAEKLQMDFPQLQLSIVVGIGGGVTYWGDDIRLGDVVVSQHDNDSSGIIAWDGGKVSSSGFQYRGHYAAPARRLLSTAQEIDSRRNLRRHDFSRRFRETIEKVNSQLVHPIQRPSQESDRLYHPPADLGSSDEVDLPRTWDMESRKPRIAKLDPQRLVLRDSRKHNVPLIHRGIIASGRSVMGSGKDRNERVKHIYEQQHGLKVLCFEMEAAEVVNIFPCLVIKGISDYADEHKTDEWRDFAALSAAAYARTLIEALPIEKPPAVNEFSPRQSTRKILIPFSRDDKFIDRPELFEDIQKVFGQNSSHQWVALWGLGGIGKTQVAIEYAYRYHETQPGSHIFWIYAGTRDRIIESFQMIARKLRLPGYDDNSIDDLMIVLRHLEDEDNGSWLVLLDNANEGDVLTDFYQPAGDRKRRLLSFIPSCRHGRVLSTSRDRVTAQTLAKDITRLVHVDVMSQEESMALFKLRVPLEDSDLRFAQSLLESLNNIPLSISTAGAYIAQNRSQITVQSYQESFTKTVARKKSLLQFENADDRRDHELYNESILATWEITTSKLEAQHELALKVLDLIAMYHCQDVPSSLVEAGLDIDPEESASILESYAMITIRKISHFEGEVWTCFTTHSLVQHATLMRLKESNTYSSWVKIAMNSMHRNLLHSDLERENVYFRYLVPHIPELIQHGIGDRTCEIARSNVLQLLASFCCKLGLWGSAESMAETSLRIYGHQVPEQDDAWISKSILVGKTYNLKGRHTVAELLQRTVVDVAHTRLGATHDMTLEVMDDLALSYMHLGAYKKAFNLQRARLDHERDLHGDLHERTLAALENISNTCNLMGEGELAEQLTFKVLNARMNALGNSHSLTQKSRRNLAATFVHQGRWEEASAMQEELFKYYPDKHIPAEDLHLRGNIQVGLGRHEEAVKIFEDFLERESELREEDDPAVINVLTNIAVSYLEQKQFHKADACLSRALDIVTRAVGPSHPRTLEVRVTIGQSHRCQNRDEEALNSFHEVLADTLRIYGRRHPIVYDAWEQLAHTRIPFDHPKAKRLVKRTIKFNKTVWGDKTKQVFQSQCLLGLVYLFHGRYHKAMALLQDIRDGMVETYGPDRDDIKSFNEVVCTAEAKFMEARSGVDTGIFNETPSDDSWDEMSDDVEVAEPLEDGCEMSVQSQEEYFESLAITANQLETLAAARIIGTEAAKQQAEDEPGEAAKAGAGEQERANAEVEAGIGNGLIFQ